MTYELHLDGVAGRDEVVARRDTEIQVKRLACVRQGKTPLGLSDEHHVMLKTSLRLTKHLDVLSTDNPL
jgi:hypothetical protein